MTSQSQWSVSKEFWPLAESSRFVTVDANEWHVQITGAGPDVLCLHGAGASSHSFAGLTAAISNQFRVTTPDLPGQGFSELLPLENVSLSQFSEKLHLLLGNLSIEPQWIVAHSAGAALAAQYLLDHETKVRGLLSINGAFNPFGSVAAPLFSKAAKLLARNRFLPRLLASPSLRWRATGSMLSDTGSKLDPLTTLCYETLLSNPEHISGTLRMMAGWNLPQLISRLSGLSLPVWLVACERDRTIPPERSTLVEAYLPNSRCVDLPLLGHLGHEENPQRFAMLLKEFVSAEE